MMAMPLALILRTALGLSTAHAAQPCTDTIEPLPAERDMQTHLRQARHFEKKGWVEDALREASMALSTPEGRDSPEAYALGARLARSRDNIVGARCLAAHAVKLQKSGVDTEQARALMLELDRSFGYLVVNTSGDATSAALRLQLPRVFASAELKAYAERTAQALSKRQPLPVHIALPTGTYLVSGQAVTVLAGQTQEVNLHPKDTRPALASPVMRLHGGAALQPTQAHTAPKVMGAGSVSASWPVWRSTSAALHTGMRLGGLAPARSAGGTRLPAGGELGLQVSAYSFLAIGMDLRVEATVGLASLSGIGWSCPLDRPSCTPRYTGAAPADTLYLRDLGVQARVTAGIDFRGIGRADDLGIGFDLTGARTSGTLPSSSGTTHGLRWSVDDPAWSILSITPGLSLSVRR